MASIISTKTSGGGGIAVTGDTSGVLQLASNNGTIAVTVDASQNVGIGTASPTQKLHVSTSSAEVSRFESTGSVGYIRVKNSTVESLLLSDSTNGLVKIGSISNTPVVFNTNDTERMRIDSSGNVLVGTTSTAPRDFSSGGGAALQPSAAYEYATANSTVSFMNYTGSASGAGTFIAFRQQGATRGSISTNGSTTAYNTSSDYRLKENIAPMTGALETVAKLKPSTYTWKETGEDSQGFIAHELAEVVPDCVTGEKDAVDADGNPQYQGIDTSFLVATLTAAIQELSAKVTALEEQVINLGVK
jgi:hypothetical protein